MFFFVFLNLKMGGGSLHPSPSPPSHPTPEWAYCRRYAIYMYYYTPLPLNIANNKQQATSNKQQATSNKQQATSNKQARRLLSVLAITPFHRFRLYSTIVIPYRRWWPCQIQVLSQKLTGGLPKLRILCPKTAFFGPKWPRNQVKTARQRETIATLNVRLDCRMTKSPLLPSNSTICPRNGPKMAENGLNVRRLCQQAPKPRTGRILGYLVAQNRILRAPSPPATPHFLWFPSL